MSSYASPATDILYFFATSLNEEVYHNYREHLVKLYHASLINLMKRLECKAIEPPTMQQLNEALAKRAFYELIVTFSVRPLIMAQKKDVKDINEMFESENKINLATVRDANYRKTLVKRLPIFKKLGLFD